MEAKPPPQPWVVALVLALVTLAVYSPSLSNRFVNWDDIDYVAANPAIAEGLTWPALRWAFTSFYASNWHPLAWVSHAIDVDLFGRQNAWGHHLTSMVLHAVAAAALLLALEALTRRLWAAAVAAALFALHPLHVESVSWVSERKDVLCGLFFFLALWAHARYAVRPTWRGYLAVAGATAAALLSKPMAVTLPLALLVLDGWPLRRLSWRALAEKAPLLAMSAGVCAATWLAQTGADSVRALEEVPLPARAGHVVYAYAAYLVKAFWPAPGSLVPFYPLPGRGGPQIGAAEVAMAGALLLAITALAVLFRHRRPYLLAGWLWYLGTLVPVIGLVQVGTQLLADRYTYVPLVGVFVAVVWLVEDLLPARPATRRGALAAAGAVLLGLSALTWQQQAVWRNSLTLWTRVAQAFPQCSRAWTALGHIHAGVDPDEELRAQRDLTKAGQCYGLAIRLQPMDFEACSGMGMVLTEARNLAEGEKCLRRAVEINPRYADGQYNLGAFLLAAGKPEEAARRFRLALEIDPGFAAAAEALAKLRGRGIIPSSGPAGW